MLVSANKNVDWILKCFRMGNSTVLTLVVFAVDRYMVVIIHLKLKNLIKFD